jgi:hypothetical protein
MSSTQNSISSLVAQFLRLQKNSMEIINGLNEVATSTNDNVEIQMLDEMGVPKKASIPAYGYLRSEIKRLDSNIQALSGLGDNFSTVRNSDGTYSQIYKYKPLQDPAPLANLKVPSTFSTKDNWFFESFMSPLLVTSIDVTGQVPDDTDRIVLKRVILNPSSDDQKSYFDTNLKGRNDLTESQFISELEQNGIDYFIDEDIIQLPLRKIKYVGGFNVISFYDDTVATTDANGNTVQESRRNYKLNKITYTDTGSDLKDTKTLAVNDTLLTKDGSQYRILSVDISETSVQLKRVSGYQPVQIGEMSLSFSSTDLGPRYIDVNVGYDERQGVFFKKIDDNYNIVSSTWSKGITFWSNDLRINTPSRIQTLEQFYLSSVADVGRYLLSIAKEKKIPSYEASIPNVPILEESNFRVVQVNTQLTEGLSAKSLKEKVAQKKALQSEISQLDKAISQQNSTLNSIDASQASGVSALQISNLPPVTPAQNNPAAFAELKSLTDQRAQKQNLLNSVVSELSQISAVSPQLTVSPKYRVRGFWAIPEPVSTPQTGEQNVVQFIVQYRYLSDSGVASPVQQISFLDNNGQEKSGSFSNWVEIKSEIRKKVYDNTTGTYVWAPENTADSNTPNINQLDIPITSGEQVEIRVKSVSEAGWPDNPAMSDFSPSVIIAFPQDLPTESVSSALQTNATDLAVSTIQQDLESKGLMSFLNKQFTVGNQTYYLDSQSVSSGFYNTSGSPLSLLQKLTEMQDQINSLQALINNSVGELEVYVILEDTTTKIKVKPGTSIDLPQIAYSEVYANPTTTDAGKIYTATYGIQIMNAGTGVLELASSLPGGLDVLAGSSSYSYPEGYLENLKYGSTPISNTSLVDSDIRPAGSTTATTASFQQVKQAPPYASGNMNGQFIYPRWKSVGYDVSYYNDAVPYSSWNSGYTYEGDTSGLPRNGSALIPYLPAESATPPSYPNGGSNANIWGGTYTSGSPDGNGFISEFCVHISHPAIASGSVLFEQQVKPGIGSSVNYPAFRHSDYFYTSTSDAEYWKQLGYASGVETYNSSSVTDAMYPNKLGFSANDEYLVGKYSCGAYLFLGPKIVSNIQVEGSTSLASKGVQTGETNAITIPVVFQFRATDKLGYIGGYRNGGNPSNITYKKRIGFDIQVRNKMAFSFDLSASGSYKLETLAGFSGTI